MNKKQQMIKKLAKRAKARQNKVVPDNPSSKPKERYISKAERAKLALEQESQAETVVESETSSAE
ncbi:MULTISPECIES: DUF2986 domain-containing protein [Pseudomonadati]|uniref:DUF2986 domain-containing protein n=1 Tax=Shewanella aestuarii TaxID=1028752 RepID=A0ABT0KWJ5_9GAMM|nr:DUF2986 domain-containing protein [Shewanella aestuarii]MCL1115759.1 DUF2986 domain-containing protein [Shewanella aestuarii]GGN68663.1 hypothetical protein GCM10009193_01850 [Shewanella aestuarii]